jgi:hypothetical protein
MNWLKYCEPENWRDEAKLYPIIPDDELKKKNKEPVRQLPYTRLFLGG